MILSSINVTVIPFLIEMLIFDVDHTKWNFGTEYTFKVKKTTALYTNIFENVTATIKCHPNERSEHVDYVLVLFCEADKIILSTLSQQSDDIWEDIMDNRTDKIDFSPHIKELEGRTFTMQFGTRGVDNFVVSGGELNSHLNDHISNIVEQFDMGLDLSTERNSMKNYENVTSGTHVISSLMQTNENTVRASKCNTSLIITYTPSNHSHDHKNHQESKNNTNYHFYLKLLPISYTKPATRTFSIKRERMACRNQPKNIEFLNEKWIIKNFTKYYNVMKLRRTRPKFTSHTYLEGYVISRQKRIVHFWEDMHLELHRIKPIE